MLAKEAIKLTTFANEVQKEEKIKIYEDRNQITPYVQMIQENCLPSFPTLNLAPIHRFLMNDMRRR